METKIVTRHVWDEYLDIVEDLRHDRINKKIYEKRSCTIKRVFANLKERHNHRFTRYKGKERVRTDMTLVFACMNLKKLANWLSRQEDLTPDNINLLAKITYFLELMNELQVKKSQL